MHDSDLLMPDATVYLPQDTPLQPRPPAVHLVSDEECASVDRLQHVLLFMARPNYTHVVLYVVSTADWFPTTLNTPRSIGWLLQHLISRHENTKLCSAAGRAELLALQNKCSNKRSIRSRGSPCRSVKSYFKNKIALISKSGLFSFFFLFLPCEQLALISTWAQIVAHFTTRRDYHLADRLYVHPCGGTGSLFILPFWLHAWARGSNIWASGLLSLCHRRCCARGNVHSEDLETASDNIRLCVDDEWYICSLHL